MTVKEIIQESAAQIEEVLKETNGANGIDEIRGKAPTSVRNNWSNFTNAPSWGNWSKGSTGWGKKT